MARFRTHYDNLQVARTASPEVIRAAYKGLVQKWHPDRNPPEQREKCNRIMTLLNRAYEVLSDPEQRAAHDRWIAEREAGRIEQGDQFKAAARSAPAAHLTKADFKCVTARFVDLPVDVRGELLAAANQRLQGYVSAATEVAWKNILGICIAITGICVVGLVAASENWSAEGRWWALGIVFVLLYWGVRRAAVIKALVGESLSYKVLLTPTHIVETDAATARVWPILGTRRFQMTVHTRNGSYVGSTIDFDHVGGHATTFNLSRRKESEALHQAAISVLSSLDSRMSQYVSQLQRSPLFHLDDGLRVSRRLSPWIARLKAAALAAVLATAVHWGAVIPLNDSAPRYQGVAVDNARQASAPRRPQPLDADELSPVAPMPPTGWIQPPVREAIAPLMIHAESDTNYYIKMVDPYGKTVAKMFLRAGETLQLRVPLGTYRIRYAYGSQWHGETSLFGNATRYSELERNMTFYRSGSEVGGVEITLTKQLEGNLEDRRLRADEF